MDPAKLKVVELRAELSQRGLDTKGNKAALVERLRQALENERTDQSGGDVQNVSDSSDEESGSNQAQEPALPVPRTPSRATRTAAAIATAVVAPKTPTRSTMRSARQSAAVRPQMHEEDSKSNSEDDEPLAKMSKMEEKPDLPEMEKPPEVQQPSIPVQSPVKLQGQQSPVRPQESPMKPQPSVQQSPDKLQEPESPVKIASPVKPLDKSPPTKEPEQCILEPERSPTIVHQQSPIKPAQSPKQAQKPSEEKGTRNLTEVFQVEVSQVTPALISPVKSVQPEAKLPDETESQQVASPVKDVSPKKIEASSKKIEASPKEIEASPKKIEASPKKVEASPKKVEASPKKAENNSQTEEKMEVDQEKDIAQVQGVNKIEEQDVDGKEVHQNQDNETQNQDNATNQDRKRKRSMSPQEDVARPKPDDEPEFDDDNVMLSWYDSDLNLQINQENFTSATPMHKDGFGLVWAGARASYGFNSGKIYYEAKIVEKCSIDIQDETSPHILRVGWSVAGTSMQLGEEKFSYGYDGTGKKTTECNFSDYGVEFGAGDVIVSYLDMSDEKIVKMSYAVNSKDLGVAFEVNKEELGENALFPHVLTKNCIFACNFGQEDRWSETILDGYTPAAKVESKDRIAGPKRPTAKEECEMIMMCGLPGSGKTFWCTKYASEHPEKMYNILGTSSLINKMKVMGLPRKENYQGRWETLLSMCTRALNILVEKAYTRRRNYILDHHNVYPSAQKRKMRNFAGFSRRAVIVVPTDVEYKARRIQREQTEGKEVPDSTVLEMKASFAAPEVGELLSSVEWPELNEEEAKKVIDQYNKEGKAAGYGQQQHHQNKRARMDSKDGRDNRFNNRDHRRGGGGYQDRRNAGWRGGGNNGGWRDNRAPGRGGHMRPHGSYGGPGGWRPRGPPPLVHRSGSERRGAGADRRQGNDRSRQPPPRQGAWGQSGYQGQQQGNWSQQGSWSGSQSQGWNQSGWGNNQQWNWQKYGQGNYGTGYNQNYDNGNYGGWNQQQYYNQYWDQPQHSGQMAAGSQAVNAASSVTYDYSEDCHDYTQT